MLSELCDDLDSYIGTFCVHIQNDKIHSLSSSIFLTKCEFLLLSMSDAMFARCAVRVVNIQERVLQNIL
jgi:hypothetical protein